MNDVEQAKTKFEEFRKNVYHQFIVKLRRYRAAQLRELLLKPEEITNDVFNAEVWRAESKTLLKGEKAISSA